MYTESTPLSEQTAHPDLQIVTQDHTNSKNVVPVMAPLTSNRLGETISFETVKTCLYAKLILSSMRVTMKIMFSFMHVIINNSS